ncbi:hypothetical protein [Methylobacterium trifolii]|uniref:Uncharacterized protein n=1 Tax=Methylobacterium trifolii TaxID=1003092 RepID=A0ABQ4TTH3_9HYPH|nr:hypothetical protein [Methylobacterium trifolii]GJE58037.1 hypothetical protein MPOCJGCO_0114 [Methylobacterium trifolii]
MSTSSETRAVAFDPFGEPVEFARSYATEQGDRRARNAAIAVFWTLALLLTAGRVYFWDQPVEQVVASAQAHVAAAFSTVIR